MSVRQSIADQSSFNKNSVTTENTVYIRSTKDWNPTSQTNSYLKTNRGTFNR